MGNHTKEHELNEKEYIGRHRPKYPSKVQIVGKHMVVHCWHAIVFVVTGLAPILAFEAARPEWDNLMNTEHAAMVQHITTLF